MTAMIKMKDGSEIPADDFWLYAPMSVILRCSEPVYIKPDPTCEACGAVVKADWKHCAQCGRLVVSSTVSSPAEAGE